MTDRKARIREYKLTPRTMGVGAVRCTTTGKVLVVANQDLKAILNRQQAQLRLNAHANRALQTDWNRLGADAFEFLALDTLTPKDSPGYDPAEDLLALEELWVEKLNAHEPHGYNRPKR